jgi:hypothetical protein
MIHLPCDEILYWIFIAKGYRKLGMSIYICKKSVCLYLICLNDTEMVKAVHQYVVSIPTS